MCFYINEDTIGPIIAPEDIVCYKRLIPYSVHEAISPYVNYWYTLGEKQIDVEFEFDEHNDIEKGYHSYLSKKNADIHWTSDDDYNDCRTYECIIPSGSTYYNNKHEYVSTSIVVIKLLE